MSAPPQPAKPPPKWLRIPTFKSSDGDVIQYMRDHLYVHSPRRRWQTQRAALNLWMYLGRQWIEAKAEVAPSGSSYLFREIVRNSTAAFPRPVTNYIAPSVDNEIARLARKEYAPDPTAGKNEPEYMAAARLAKDILRFEMGRRLWDDKREAAIFNSVVEGIVAVRTWWDENDTEVTLVAAPDAVKCPTCQKTFASARVPRIFAENGIPTDQGFQPMQQRETLSDPEEDQAEGGQLVRMEHCPFCEQMSALAPFEMNESEAGGQDAFGRDMGLYVPRGEAGIEVLSIHEYFPENAGIGVEPYDQKVFGQIVVRPLEWIGVRYPQLDDSLSREDPGLLLRHNPLYADSVLHGQGTGFGLGSGYDAYDNHARVLELIVNPQPIEGLEQGVQFVMVNDKLIRRPLCVEVKAGDSTKMISRVKYHFARSKRIPKNYYARSFVDDQVPLNKRLNEIDAQGTDLRIRGMPHMWVPQGTELSVKEGVAGSLTVIEYDSAVGGWSPRDGLFPGMPLTGSPYAEERAQILRDLQALGAPQDIERGQAPGSVKTTSGLMLLSEEASRQRDFRERSLIRMYESVFEHFLEMQWGFRKEDATYEIQAEGGIWEQAEYTGVDLLGGIRVKMDARVGYDQTLYNKEASAEALQLGLYKLDTPDSVDRILDLMKLPKDVNEKQTLQINRAEMVWRNFIKRGEIPTVDHTLHDPALWYAVLGKRWQTDDAYLQQQDAGWPKLLPRLVLWEQRMSEMEMAEAPAKQIYGRFPQEQWPQIQQQGEQLVAQAAAAFEQVNATYQDAAATVPAGEAPPLAPPQPPPMQQFPVPPPNGFLPDAPELKIYTVWRRMLPEFEAVLVAAGEAEKLARVMAPRPELKKVKTLDGLLQMRAVIEAYRLMAQQAAMGAMMGSAAPPPPGGAEPPAPPPPGA